MEPLDRLRVWFPDESAAWEFLAAGSPFLAIPAALLVHWLTFRILLRRFDGRAGARYELLRRARRPLRLSSVILAIVIALPYSDIRGGWEDALQHVALILLIVLIGWTVILLTDHFSKRAVARHRLDVEDNLAARKYVTQVRVLQRTANIVAGTLTVILALLTFDSVQQYGTSLLASAGAAGLVLGLAARPVLSNLIAGVQIAITQPIRLEDVVIVEGEWGWVEEIYATYVVVRLWDWRRLVVPLSFFIEKPFQNWTRESASILGAVVWHLDYTAPIDAMRAKLEELVTASPYWDGKAWVLQVIDTDKDTVTIRGLMSARTAPQSWDMRCEIREKMVIWLQAEHPGALPRLRGELSLEGRMAETVPDRPGHRPHDETTEGGGPPGR